MRTIPLLTFLGCLLAMGADAAMAAPVGLVQHASGDTWIYSRTERARHLKPGQAIESGVSITTGTMSSAVLRFNDGQIVVLASNATFRVKNFVYDPDRPGQGQLHFELVKGGMRAVTGSIGGKNRGGWLLETPAANIGIVGTDFFAVVEQGLYTHVNAGAVTLSNDAGVATIAAGGNGFVAGEAALPAITVTVPDGLFAELQALPAGALGAAASGAASPATGTGVSAVTMGTAAVAIGIAAAALAAGSGGSNSTATHH